MLKKRLKPIKYILISIGVLVGFVVLGIFYNLNPSNHSVYPECNFHASTGYLCPGCGSQRAIHDFLHFNIAEGFKHNALVGLCLFTGLYLIFGFIFNKVSSKPVPNYFKRSSTAYIILGVIAVFWILRNLPFEFFNILRA